MGLAAVDADDLAGDKRRLGEATNTMASAISVGVPTRLSGTPATSPAFRSQSGEPVQHSGFDGAGRHRIDANARCRTFECRGFRQPFDRVLARGIERRAWRASMSHGRRRVHDAALPCACITRISCFMAEQHTEHVGVESGRVAFGGSVPLPDRACLRCRRC